MNLLLVALGVAIVALQAGLWRAFRRLPEGGAPVALPPVPFPSGAPDRPRSSKRLDELTLRVAELELVTKQLPRIWSEEADRAFRAAERAEKAGRRYRAKRSDEVEAAELELPAGDDGGGAEGGVQPLRAQVASSADYLAQVRRALALAELGGGGKH